MFVCKPCKEDLNLTEAGQNLPWGKSFGECESCEDTADCEDISCQFDWAWDDNVGEQIKELEEKGLL